MREQRRQVKKISEIATSINIFVVITATVFLIVAPDSPAAGLSDSSFQKEPKWQIYIPTYVWAAGAEGTTSTLPTFPAGDVDMSFSDSLSALKDLDGALVATVFAKKDRFLLVGDLGWTRLSPTQSVPINGDALKLKLLSETFTLMAAAGYRLVDNQGVFIDAFAGAKLWYMDNSASVKPTVVTPSKVERKETWIDGVVGGHIKFKINDDFFVDAMGTVGAGGSKFYADTYGGVVYRINERWDVFAGYRSMSVEYENGWFLYDITQDGPVFGMAASF